MAKPLLKRATDAFLSVGTLSAAGAGASAGADPLFGLSGALPQVVEVDLSWIDPRPDQPRTVFDPDALAALAASIRDHGLKQPILVRQEAGGRYTLIAGERRLRAHQINQARTIVAIVVTDADPDATALIENMQRVDLDAIDLATAVQRLIERHGYSQERVAALIGAGSQSAISRLLTILRLPPPILADYRQHSATVSRSALIEIAEIEEPARQAELWEQAKAGLSRQEIRALKPPRATVAAEPADGRTLRLVGQAVIGIRKGIDRLTAHRDSLAREHLDELRTLRARIDALLAEGQG